MSNDNTANNRNNKVHSTNNVTKLLGLTLGGLLLLGGCSAGSNVASNSASNTTTNSTSKVIVRSNPSPGTVSTVARSNNSQPKLDSSRLQSLTPANAVQKPQVSTSQSAVNTATSAGNKSTVNTSTLNGYYPPTELVAKLNYPVNDFTNTLTRQELNALNQKLNTINADGMLQVGVVIVPTTGELSIYDYSLAVAQNWQLGAAKKNNGLVMMIALNDSQLYVLTGSGVEDELTDDFIKSVIESYIVPEFKIGHYMHGIDYGVDAIVNKMR